MADNTKATPPKPGEIWQARSGATRHVRSVDEDGYSVVYSRPAPAHPDWQTVLMEDWLNWVEIMGATRRRKAGAAEAKDWGYMA